MRGSASRRAFCVRVRLFGRVGLLGRLGPGPQAYASALADQRQGPWVQRKVRLRDAAEVAMQTGHPPQDLIAWDTDIARIVVKSLIAQGLPKCWKVQQADPMSLDVATIAEIRDSEVQIAGPWATGRTEPGAEGGAGGRRRMMATFASGRAKNDQRCAAEPSAKRIRRAFR